MQLIPLIIQNQLYTLQNLQRSPIHSESIEQLALNEVYVTVHFVSPSTHSAALAVRRAIHMALTVRHHQMYQ